MNKRGKKRYFSHCNFFPKNHRGSHVEIMLSFIIFVAFVLFLLSILMPSIGTQKDKENIFEGIELAMINKTSSNMTIITASIASGGANCVNLDNIINNLVIGGNIKVKDSLGEDVTSMIDGSSIQINRISVNDTFFKIYYSEEFMELDSSSGCLGATYEIGTVKTNKYVFEKKFLELMNENYETLKDEIKVPEGIGFGYGLILSNGTTIGTDEGELSTNVYIKETPIEYVDLNGNILEGYIKTKIW